MLWHIGLTLIHSNNGKPIIALKALGPKKENCYEKLAYLSVNLKDGW